MEPRPTPKKYMDQFEGEEVRISKPSSVSEEDCRDAQMYVESVTFGDMLQPMFTGWFQPTQEELRILQNGGYIGFSMIGHVVPYSTLVQEI